MISPRPCRACGSAFDISGPALAKGNYMCRSCRKTENAENLRSRKERGLIVSGSRMPKSWHRQYNSEYNQKECVKKRRLALFYERLKCPIEKTKYEARMATRNAIRRGDIVRAPCVVCGQSPAQAHHEDYSRPLDVMWLCVRHHSEHHAKARGES